MAMAMSMSSVDIFLKVRRITKGDTKQVITHTNIGNRDMKIYGGSYNIDAKDLTAFFRAYVKTAFVGAGNTREPVLKANAMYYLTEKQLDQNGAITIDMDMKYHSKDVNRRLHDESFLIEVIRLYLNELFSKMADMDQLRKTYGYDHIRFNVYVMQKDHVVVDAKNHSVLKDGVHIIIGLGLDRNHQVALRELVLPKAAALLEATGLPLINQVDDVFDLAVSSANANWQMYGSRKPGCDTYKLSYHYEWSVKLDQNASPDQDDRLLFQYRTVYSRTPIPTAEGDEGGPSLVVLERSDSASPSSSQPCSSQPSSQSSSQPSSQPSSSSSSQPCDWMVLDQKIAQFPDHMDLDWVTSYDGRHRINGHFCIAEQFHMLSARHDAHEHVPIRKDINASASQRPASQRPASQRPATRTDGQALPLVPFVPFHVTAMSFDLGTINDVADIVAATDKLLQFYRDNRCKNPHLFVDNENQPIDLLEIHDYVDILPASYYEMGQGTYMRWMKVGWALKNTSEHLFPLWLKFSAKATGFRITDIADMHHTWERKSQPRNSAPITWKSIRYWAKDEDPERAKKIYNSNIYEYMDNTLSSSDFNETDVANVLYKMYGDRFICADIKTNKWYTFVRHRWKENDCATTLRKMLTGEMTTMLLHIIGKKLTSAIDPEPEQTDNGNDDDEDESAKEQKAHENKKNEIKFKRLSVVKANISRTSHKRNIMHEAMHEFKDECFAENLNKNPYLLGFDNGVYDFTERRFRPGRADDYITLSTNLNYVPIDRSNEDDVRCLAEIEDFFRQLFPEPDVCEYMWKHLASCVLGTVLHETINIYVGKGRNGKTKLTELMKMALGDYYGDVPVALVTQSRAKVGGTTSEVAQLRFTRYAVMQEPSKGDKINDGVLKQLTGGDQINARELYQTAFSFQPMFKLVLATNNLPEIGSNDDGIWRRVRVVKYLSKFCEEPYKDETAQQCKYQFPVDVDIKVKFHEWVGVFIARLIEIALETKGHVVDCASVTEASNLYRNKQDYMTAFFNAYVVRDTSGAKKPPYITKSSLNERFALWFKGHYGQNVPRGVEIYEYMDSRCGHHVSGNGGKWVGYYLSSAETTPSAVEEEDDEEGGAAVAL
jgi:P4 family phage/plasmid primase-like protien